MRKPKPTCSKPLSESLSRIYLLVIRTIYRQTHSQERDI
jgi:hypothetical protein